MAIEIVDRFEVVEVHDEQRADFILKKVIGPLGKLFEEAPPVRQSGQHVMARRAVCLVFGLFSLGHFTADVGEPSPGKGNRDQAEAKDEREQLVDFPILVSAGWTPLEDGVESVSVDEVGVEGRHHQGDDEKIDIGSGLSAIPIHRLGPR